MKKHHLSKFIIPIALTLALLAAPAAFGSIIYKAAAGTDLTAGASWSNSVAPASGDVAAWAGVSLGAGLNLPASVSWQGISVAGAASAITITNTGTLTLGTAGIDLSAATVDVTISSSLTLATGSQSWNIASGRTLTLNTGTFTRNTGTTVNLPGAGTVAVSMTGLAVDSSKPSGILGAWTFVNNTNYATLSGVNIAAYTGGSSSSTWGFTDGSGNTNYNVTAASGTTYGGSTRNVNTVRYTGGADTLTLGNNASGAQLVANGIINAGTGTLSMTNGTGSTTSAGLVPGANKELVLNAATAPITIGSRVHDNSGGASALVIVGPNTVTLNGSNNFTGGTYVNSGPLTLGNANALGTGALTINSGSIATFAANNATFANTISGSGAISNNTANTTVFTGDHSGFSGTFTHNAGANNSQFNSASSCSQNAAYTLLAGEIIFALSGDYVVTLGSLASASGDVRGGNAATGTTTVQVGNLNTSTTLVAPFNNGGTKVLALTKVGTGTLTLAATNTYGGNTTISTGTLALTGGALITNTPNISIASGAFLDVSGLSSTFTLGASGSQSISNGIGTVKGPVATAAGGSLSPDAGGVAGTLTFNTNLNMSAGGAAFFDLSTSASSGNDKIVVGGNLTVSASDSIHINALSGSSPLDQTTDYVLFSVTGATAMASTPALVWDNTPPSNSGNFYVVKVGNNVVLHYSTGTPPTVTATISPDPSGHYQAVTITATVTPGTASIASVKVDLTPIGGSATASLVLSSANVYTNTFTVGGGTLPGTTNLIVTVTDTTAPTPLNGSYNLSMTVNASSLTWNGSGANNSWNGGANWLGGLPPGLVGDAVTFDGTSRPLPDMTNNYSVTGVTFNSGAGAFVMGSSTSSTLTSGSDGIVNNSANAQTFNVAIVAGTAQTFAAASGNLVLNSNILANGTLTMASAANTSVAGSMTGTGGLTKTGNGTLTLTGVSTFGGNAWWKGGTTVIDTGGNVTTPTWCSIGQAGTDNATLTMKGTGAFTAFNDFNVGDIDATVGTLNIQDSAVVRVSSLFIGSANAASSTASGTVNMNGGSLIETNTAIGNFVVGGRSAGGTNGVAVINLTNGYISVACGVRLGDYGTGTINQYGGLLEVTNGATGVNLRRESTGVSGTYNLNGGILRTEKITSSQTSGTREFYFNGGTVQAGAGNLGATPFLNNLSHAYVRDGGAIIDDRGYPIIISQVIEHSVIGGDNATDGGLIKLGAGTLTLAATNTYTGPTTVSNGTLQVDGSIAGPTTVKSGGTLGGNGSISNNVTVQSGGSIGAGDSSIGTLTVISNLTLNAGSTNIFEVNGSTPANDRIVLGANVTYGGTLSIVTNGAFYAGETFTLFSGAGAVNPGNFASIQGSPGSGLMFTFTNGVLTVATAPTGPTLTSVAPNPVPGSSYPVTLSLTGSGFTGATAVLLTNTTASTGASYSPTVNNDTSLSVNFVPGTTASSWNATVVNGTPSSQVGFSVTAPPSLQVTKASVGSAGAGKVVLNGTGGTAGYSYVVVSATNLNPPAVWSPVVTNTFDGSGNFSYTNTVNSAKPKLFLRVQL